jgi:hypothetical protein
MLFIWSGFGFLTPVIGVGVTMVGTMIGALLHVPFNYSFALGLLIAAAVNWYVGSKLNDPNKDGTVIDQKTGRQLVLRRRHKLFFIPMQYFSILAVVAAVAVAWVGPPR